MTVRRASARDTEAATMLLREYDVSLGSAKREDQPETIAAFIGELGAGLWLAEVDAQPAGCVVLWLLPEIDGAAECKRLYVRPAFRCRGIAGALLDRLEGHALGLGRRWIYLDSKDDHPEALRIYRRRGYVACPRYNDNPLATIFMRKALANETVSLQQDEERHA